MTCTSRRVLLRSNPTCNMRTGPPSITHAGSHRKRDPGGGPRLHGIHTRWQVVKALTVKQPWATLILAGGKDVENRSRRTHYRGPLAIHVSQSMSSLTDSKNQEALRHVSPELMHLALLATSKTYNHRGYFLGTVDLVDCVRDSTSPWA